MEIPPALLMTRAEVARAFQVNPNTVTRWGRQRLLTSVRTPGGHRRYLRSEVDGFFVESIPERGETAD